MTTRSAIATHFGITGYDAIAEKAYELLKRIDSQYEGRAWPAKRHDLADDVKSIKTPLRRLAQLKYVKIKNGETLRRPRHGHSGATTAACAAGRTSGTFACAASVQRRGDAVWRRVCLAALSTCQLSRPPRTSTSFLHKSCLT